MATVADSENILKIYAPYIRDTAISFETKMPSSDEFSDRIENITKRYPFIRALAKFQFCKSFH